MTVAYLAPSLRLKSWLNNGQPNAFGTIATYAAGTATPVATYTDNTATVQNTNPIVLNQRGEASVWMLPNVAYKLIEFDQSGNQLDTTDQVVNSQLVTYYGTDSGFANNYILTAATPYTAYQNGQLVFFVAANTNTGPSTVNINNLGPIPITTINEGVSAFRRVILYPSQSMVPRLNTTPMITTLSDSSIALMLRKKARRIIAERTTDPSRNQVVSKETLVAIFVRIRGRPL